KESSPQVARMSGEPNAPPREQMKSEANNAAPTSQEPAPEKLPPSADRSASLVQDHDDHSAQMSGGSGRVAMAPRAQNSAHSPAMMTRGPLPRSKGGGWTPDASYNPNLYLSNTYMGGAGDKDRIEKLINEGVVVDGKRVKLEAFSRTYAQTFPIPTES